MFKIGYRTLKTAIGVVISISIAEFLHLENAASAGILTMLSIQPTKKKSFKSAMDRIIAGIIITLLSLFFFEVVGYHPLSIGLLLLVFIPLSVKLNLINGLITSSVMMISFYVHGMHLEVIVNEASLFCIGVGIALALNWYMPSLEKELKENQAQLEIYFKSMLIEIAKYLKNGDQLWNGAEIYLANELIVTSKQLALKNLENQFAKTDSFYSYFVMREKQLDIIEQMLPLLTRISKSVEQSFVIAKLIDGIQQAVKPQNAAMKFLGELKQLREFFKASELPKTREEFEIRASLFNLLNLLEQYLTIKYGMKDTY